MLNKGTADKFITMLRLIASDGCQAQCFEGDSDNCYSCMEGMLQKAADYMEQMVVRIEALEAVEKKYAEAEREGRLIITPAKQGDPVWFLLIDSAEPDGACVCGPEKIVEVTPGGFYLSGYLDRPDDMSVYRSWRDVGKEVFFSQGEARKAKKAYVAAHKKETQP